MTVISLLLAVVAAVAAPEPPPAPVAPVVPGAPVVPVEPVPVVLTPEARGALFTGWATALASGNRDAAAQALVTLIDDPTKTDVHGEAWAHLGEIYEQMGLTHAAIGAYGTGLRLDPTNSASVLPKALALVEAAGESGFVAEALGKNVGIQASGADRNRLALIAARYNLDHDNPGPAYAILMMADKDAAGFEDVELMRGVALSQQGQHGAALAPFLTAQALGIKNERDANWRNVAQLNVARAYYSDGNYGQAIDGYSKIERSSDYWLDAQFERAWAHFRGEDANGALAMLHTHDSAFFESFYNPEGDLLRAYSLFVMCKFSDATKEMDAFLAKYAPIQTELGSVSLTPEEGWADLKAYRAGQPTKAPAYLMRPFRHEERLDHALKSVADADAELAKAGQTAGRVGEIAKDLIARQQQERVEAEGQRVVDRVAKAKAEVDDMLNGIEITRLDLLNLETQMYERAAATGVLDYGSRVDQLRDLKKKKRGFRVWPWQGEAWADELGWYVFSARPDCPESMARGVPTGVDAPSR